MKKILLLIFISVLFVGCNSESKSKFIKCDDKRITNAVSEGYFGLYQKLPEFKSYSHNIARNLSINSDELYTHSIQYVKVINQNSNQCSADLHISFTPKALDAMKKANVPQNKISEMEIITDVKYTVSEIGKYYNINIVNNSEQESIDIAINNKGNILYGYDDMTVRANLSLITRTKIAYLIYKANYNKTPDNFNEDVMVSGNYIKKGDLCFIDMNCYSISQVEKKNGFLKITDKSEDVAIILDVKDSFLGCMADSTFDDGNPSTGEVMAVGKNAKNKVYSKSDCYGNAPNIQYGILAQ